MPTLVLQDVTTEYERGGYVVRPIDGFGLDVSDGELVLLPIADRVVELSAPRQVESEPASSSAPADQG